MTLPIGNKTKNVGGFARLRVCALQRVNAPTRQRANTRTGLTLVEILVSIAILATAMAFILQAFARGAYLLAVTKNRMGVYAFASAKLADLELSLLQGGDVRPEGEFRLGREACHWRVESVPSDDPELELVTLTVGWRQSRRDYESAFPMVHRIAKEQGT